MSMKINKGNPLILKGSAFERGFFQSQLCPEMIKIVREKILSLLTENKDLLQSEKARSFLARQIGITQMLFPGIHEEVKGIAKGFALTESDLFNFYHLRIILDMDGCSSWGVSVPGKGAVVGKNRDLAAGNKILQRVFIHEDPDWQGNRVLSIGSLGAPFAYSSGINSHGFCLADTNILTSDHGPGACRYFLMPFLLASCKSVDQAVRTISDLPHAGGGSLVMGDIESDLAVVELGHCNQNIKIDSHWLATTNHFTSEKLRSANLSSAESLKEDSSEGRLQVLNEQIPALFQDFSLKNAMAMMKSHDSERGLCRHLEKESSSTISGAVFNCADKTLHFSDGYPCNAQWYEFSL
jgi:isopenicillin-N N-acyltransferase like protein